jgi:hypothetical protein
MRSNHPGNLLSDNFGYLRLGLIIVIHTPEIENFHYGTILIYGKLGKIEHFLFRTAVSMRKKVRRLYRCHVQRAILQPEQHFGIGYPQIIDRCDCDLDSPVSSVSYPIGELLGLGTGGQTAVKASVL